MRLLISVRDGAEASAALAGGADLIDAKDPAAGSLGAVALQALMGIHRAVGSARPVTAALGDAATETSIEQLAFAFASAGTAFVKVGFAGISDLARVTTLLRAAVHGARSARCATCGVIAVGYADSAVVESLPWVQLNTAAADAGAAGVLIDTADKQGPGLPHLITFPMFTRWCREAREAGLLVAAAGRLTPQDLTYVRDAGVDVVGFRGAACDGGRTGQISREKVSALRELVSPYYSLVDHR